MMGTADQDKEKVGNKIMSLMILTCYQSISLEKGRDV